jgi:hypothetical protein
MRRTFCSICCRLTGGWHWSGRWSPCGGPRSERVEILWEFLEFRKRDVAADGIHQSEHDEKDGSKEEGRYLVHGQFEIVRVCMESLVFSR